MAVYEFCEMCVNLFIKVKIWDCTKKDYVFDGEIEKVKHCEYACTEMTSFEVDDCIIINI